MSVTTKRVPRVLIVARDPLSDTQNNGKTLAAFFRGWDRECLAQLYLRTAVPDFTVCDRFFQLHDFDLLRRLCGARDEGGREVRAANVPKLLRRKEELLRGRLLGFCRRHMGPLLRLVKDLVWYLGGFKTRALREFLDDFDPEVVFFQSQNGVGDFALALWIVRERQLPLVMQTTDDFVTPHLFQGPFALIHGLLLRRAYRRAAGRARAIVAISDAMAAEYARRFGGTYVVAMNASAAPPPPAYRPRDGELRLLYTGNLGLGRAAVLARLGACLAKLARAKGLCAELEIYTLVEPNRRELLALTQSRGCVFRGSAGPEELMAARARADVLVHVESFARRHRQATRLSLSTKIPEYLAAGRTILAVGPQEVASIAYLQELEVGPVVTSTDEAKLFAALTELLTGGEARARAALAVARERHDPQKTAALIYELVTACRLGREDFFCQGAARTVS